MTKMYVAGEDAEIMEYLTRIKNENNWSIKE